MPTIQTLAFQRSPFSQFGFLSENPKFSSDDDAKHLCSRITTANQGTAQRISDIGALRHSYPARSAVRTSVALFTCHPRNSSFKGPGLLMPIDIMERHPFTTQTFCPLGLANKNTASYYIVVVAPDSGFERPDMQRARAFVGHGGQAVTYGANVWHSPMIVVGQSPVDFIVTQFVNGIPSDDCQEIAGLSSGSETFNLSLRTVEQISKAFSKPHAKM